jgi:lysophospholipase L1-like esterase
VETPSPGARRGASRTLLTSAGVIFVTGAAVHNTWFVSLAVRAARALLHRPGIAEPDPGRVHAMQLAFLAAGAALLAASWLVGRVGPLDRWFRRPLVERILLSCFVIAVPVGWLELALRAFVPPQEKTTSLFVRDDTLGWKLRASAVDEWGGVEVRVNERGFRGPVVPYPRTAGTRRILYLGDSVTFGYRIARWEDTYPYRIASILGARDSIPTETVNLAVEGYSQWQEHLLLEQEGYRYRPDLVVVGFVLNDVTEMFHLARFGGSDEGFQLRHSNASAFDRLVAKSALCYEIQNLILEVKARRRLGADVRLGALQQEMIEVETLMEHPDQPNVKTAWDYALADLQRIVTGCEAHGIPVLVAVFPFTVQLSDPERLSAPQRVIASYAAARRIPLVDLLPPLVEYSRRAHVAPDSLFLDHDHLSAAGHRATAELLANTIAVYARHPLMRSSP